MEDRDFDKKLTICADNSRHGVTLDVIKSRYIAEGLNAEQIAKECRLPVEKIQEIIEQHKLPELRKAYITEGISKIQNVQLQQSHQLMDLENNFKKLRILQIEDQLKDFVAYYNRHGDFYKRHPTTGDILKDNNGIPMQIKIPNVSRELQQLKESVTMSEGVRQLLNRLDEILQSSKPKETVQKEDVIDLAEYEEYLKQSE